MEEYCATGRGVSGNYQRNYGLDRVSAEYIYFLDDDNIIHPAMWSFVEPLLGDFAIVFNQVTRHGNRRLTASPHSIHVGGIDTAQVILPRDYIGSIRWQEDNYCADGIFFQEIYESGHTFVFYDKDLSYYNYLTS